MEHKTKKIICNPGLEIDKNDKRIKVLEDDLKEIKYKFKEAESIAHFGFWEVDPITLNPTWSDGLFKIIGINPENGQLKYFDQKKFIHPEDWDDFYNALQKVLTTKKDIELDVRITKPDGSLRIIKVIAKPKTNENDKIIGVRGTAQDITYLKEIENDLKESETFYRTLFENTGTASIIVDEDNTILMANDQFENLTNYSKEELESKMSWKDMVSPEDLEIMEKYHQMHVDGVKTPPEDYEAQLIDKEGNNRIVLINVAIIPGTTKSIASLLDLSERKKMEKKLADSERRYRYIVEKAAAGMFILDKDGIIKYLNDHMAYLLDYTKNEMLENHIKSFVEEEGDFYRPRKHLDTKIEQYNWFKLLQKEGNVFWSNLTVSPIFNSKNEYTGLLGIVTDINMQKGLEEAFLEREKVSKEIIYDMMEMLNKFAMDKVTSEPPKNELSDNKNLDNN